MREHAVLRVSLCSHRCTAWARVDLLLRCFLCHNASVRRNIPNHHSETEAVWRTKKLIVVDEPLIDSTQVIPP